MLLWIVFAALSAAALAAVLWPLTRPRVETSARAAFDATIYRDQLGEIERDLERGLIAPAEAEAARTEISRRLLAAADAGPRGGARPLDKRASGVAIACAVLCVPLLSLALYLVYGSPALPDRPLAARLEAPTEQQELAGLIAKVEARLRAQPQDGAGWDVIAPVYLRLGRYNDAADAYKHALRLEGRSPARLAGLGEALVLANNGIVTEEALQAFRDALDTEPGLLRPRFWVALAKEQDGDFAEAVADWRTLLREAEPDAPWRPMVEERLRVAKAHLDRSPVRGPGAEEIAAAQSMSEAERAAMIEAMVEGLAARLARDGGDLEGWLRLVRAYDVLGRQDDAARALGEARRNFDGDARAASRLDELARGLGL